MQRNCDNRPKKSVNIKITDRPMKGTKNIIINAIANNKTRVDVQWDIKVKGFFGMFTGISLKSIFPKEQKTPWKEYQKQQRVVIAFRVTSYKSAVYL